MNMLGLRDLVFIAPTHSLHHHHHHHHQQGQTIISQDQHNTHGGHTTNNNNNTDNNNIPLPPSSLSVGLGIFPLLTATPCMPPQDDNNNNVHHHDQQEHVLVNTTANNSSYWNLKMCPEVSEHDGGGDENNNGGGGGGGLYGPEFRVCQDCGNRAKKDCSYKRCRTCCKGRGYDCSTHVKSTWVPVSHRRARDIAVVAASAGGDGVGGSNNKRLKGFGSSQTTTTTTNTSHSSTSNATTTKSLDSTSCHQDAEFKQSLPGQVRAPAAFKCHRVSAIGNGEDEITYLATVQICGHVFKGFLYDQGADGKNEVPCVSVLQLGNSGSGKNNNNNGECSSPTPIGVPITAYPASAC